MQKKKTCENRFVIKSTFIESIISSCFFFFDKDMIYMPVALQALGPLCSLVHNIRSSLHSPISCKAFFS